MVLGNGSQQQGKALVEGDGGGRRRWHLSTEVADDGGRGGRWGRKAGSFVDDVNNGDDKDVLSSLRSKPVLKAPVNLCQFQLKETFYLWHDGIISDVVKKIAITSTSD